MKVKKIFFFTLLLCFISASHSPLAQTQKELEKKRTAINSQIHKTNNKLLKTRQAQKNIKNDLKSLQQKIGFNDQSLLQLTNYVDSIDTKIDHKIIIVRQLEDKLKLLKENYKTIVRQLYRYHLLHNNLNFIWSIDGFNQAYQNWVYLQHLKDNRAKQALNIKNTQNNLAKYVSILEGQKTEKNLFLAEKLEEKETLNQKKISKADKVKQLKKQANRLRKNLSRKKGYKLQLSKKIESLIKGHIAASKRVARRQQPTQRASSKKAKTLPKNSPFSQQKGRLISPIYQGKITGKFGKQQHPNFKNIYINNNGIDIKGQYNSVVKNVYGGLVISIFAIPGLNNAIMVKHDDYFTTYSNVSKIYVKQGQRVKQGAALGNIGRDTQNGGHIMHFEIWHGKQKENPSKWLKK